MKLAPGAIVDAEKVRDYLLNAAHPENSGKAALFTAFGFAPEDWQILAAALIQHAADNLVVASTRTPHGIKYVVRCHLPSPDGRNPCLISVWSIDLNRTLPRLVTAYGQG